MRFSAKCIVLGSCLELISLSSEKWFYRFNGISHSSFPFKKRVYGIQFNPFSYVIVQLETTKC